MKLPNARSSCLLILVLTVVGIAATAPPYPKLNKQLLWGTWNYTQIIKNQKVVFTAQPDDTMFLSKKGVFRYHIGGLKKEANGYFAIIKVPADSSPYLRALQFTYFPLREFGNTRRVFNIMKLNDSLVIREGTTEFCYVKQR